MNKVEQVRALFREGGVVECVKNTYIPANDGTRRRITKVGKTFARCQVIGGERAGEPFYMSLPTRVRDVIAIDERETTFLLDESVARLRGHTVTIRRVDLSQDSDSASV
jgi:hypothetical protein